VTRERRRDDRGETLIELMVAMAIMGTAVIALVGGIATSIRVSDVHRKHVNAGVYVRAFSEALERSMAASPSGYTDCASTSTYQSVYTVPSGYQATVVAVTYWNGSAFVGTCPGGGDVGVQRVTLQVGSTDGRASEQLAVIIRRPCRPASQFPLDTPCS
jgi:type II secretory pathway pseudopilin PulG